MLQKGYLSIGKRGRPTPAPIEVVPRNTYVCFPPEKKIKKKNSNFKSQAAM